MLLFAELRVSNAQNHVISNPTVVQPVKMGVSQPLRDLPISTGTEKSSWKDGIVPLQTLSDFKRNKTEVKRDGSLKEYTGPFGVSAITQNFDGVPAGLYSPPDQNGDVGPNHYVQMVNVRTQIWNKSGVSLVGPVDNSTFWSTLGPPYSTNNDGDPIVLYDDLADRWMVSQFCLPNYPSGPFYILIAVSKTADPTGQYWQYAFSFANMPDYPKFGVWPDGYYMSANMFASGSVGYLGTYAAVFDRTAMLSGGAATMQYFNLLYPTSFLSSPLPSDCDGAAPPAGAPNYFLATYDNSTSEGNTDLDIYEFHVDWGAPASTTFTGPLLLTTPAFNYIPVVGRSDIPQLGTSSKLDALDDRPMNRLQYRNFGGQQVMVVCQSLDAGGGRAGIRWWELRKNLGNWSIYQEGTHAPADGLHRWMGSIAMDAAGIIALGYSTSSSTIYPDIRYTARIPADPLGVMTFAETVIQAGGGSQTSSSSRWGDYTQMTVDPSVSGTFWYTNEYYSTTSTNQWRTRIAAFNFGPVVGIMHSPLPSTENVAGPYVVNVSIASTNPINASSVKVYWGRGVGVISDSILMTNVGGTNYQASIPGNGLSNTYNYYIKALDNVGTLGTSPGGAPGNYHSFIAAIDNTPPTITHTPISATVQQIRWPVDVEANVTDNFDVQSVQCEFKLNGGSISTFAMPFVSGSMFKGTFTGSVNIGDVIEYKIKATDNSSQNNIAYNPSSGYYSFNIIALAPILVAYDSASANGRISKDSVVTYLNNKGLSFDLFYKGNQGSTSVVSFRGRKTIIWLGEALNVMSVVQKDSVKAFLNNPPTGLKSNLIIFSEDVGYQFGRAGSTSLDLNFMNQFLGANYVFDLPPSGANQGLVGVYLNAGLRDSTVGSYPDVLSSFDPPTTHDLYKFRGDNTINAIGKIGTTFNVATFGVDIRSLRGAIDSPVGSPVPRFLDAALLYVNTNGSLTNFSLDLTAMIEGFYNGSSMVSDTVAAELRNAVNPYTLVDSKKIVLNTLGEGTGTFTAVAEGTPYYLVIKHRNSIETWSSTTQSFTSGTLDYNFTTAQSKAYGNNMIQKGTKWCLYSGDVNQDGIVDLSDMIMVDNDNANFVTGYVATDVNGDNSTDLSDMIIVDNNNAAFVAKVTPTVLMTEKRKNYLIELEDKPKTQK